MLLPNQCILFPLVQTDAPAKKFQETVRKIGHPLQMVFFAAPSYSLPLF